MDAKEFLTQFNKDSGKMKAQVGSMVDGFMGLFIKTMSDGALKTKQKELIALGIAVSKQLHCMLKNQLMPVHPKKKCLRHAVLR